ncbi:general secretion pathway protein GspN [Bradyrhizobium sp. SRS-191]|uniref:general secretion pathway protein GspN n=1 Tax=Bradyrhizobium sp. SRS-191 TaxID=2962606 RepID=UPI00211DFC9C|nr:general secretion pathway protein GspN [Bradyrhizobium sp. SRS-191]
MRSRVTLRAVALVMACMIGSFLSPAWGEEGDEPVAPVQAAATDRAAPSVSAEPVKPAAAAGPTARSANPLWDVPITILSATRDRPIFSPSRRPPPPIAAPVTVMRAPPPPPPQEPERPNLQLVGTVIGGDESFGIFLDPSSQTSLRLRLGASHEGWLLRSVESRQVTLAKDAETVTLPMPRLGQADADERQPPAPPVGRDRMARRSR